MPVDGWTAVEVPYVSGNKDTKSTTFHVIDCPLFDPEEDYTDRCNFYLCEEEKKKKTGRKDSGVRKDAERLFRYGRSCKEIAKTLNISIKTVYKHKTRWNKENNKK